MSRKYAIKYTLLIVLLSSFWDFSTYNTKTIIYNKSNRFFQEWYYQYCKNDQVALLEKYGNTIFYKNGIVTKNRLKKIFRNRHLAIGERRILGQVRFFRLLHGQIRCDFSEQIMGKKKQRSIGSA